VYDWEPGKRSRYNGWLWVGWPRGRSWVPVWETLSISVLMPTQPPVQLVRGSFFGVKQPKLETNSLRTVAEGKTTWICTSTPPYVFMAECLIKEQEQLAFYESSQ
jgi:hypothetical protein